MNSSTSCPQCGTPLPSAGAPCQRCLLAVGLEASDQPKFGPGFLDDLPLPGTSVRYVGDYELLEVIARGGMGVVYKARQKGLNRVVALKMMLGGAYAEDDFKRRFRQESEMAAKLQHPNIVPIYEVGEHEGQPYFSMEYVAGETLAQKVRDHPLLAKEAAGYVKTVAEAVHYAHQQGILHRDLKPSNILLGADNRPRVTDFGLARLVDADSSLTMSGQALGTPGYLPPEQVAAKAGTMGSWSDVYALGAVLYHLLTGRPPFAAGSMAETLDQVRHAEPVPPQQLNPAVPKDLETICLGCLQKEPTRRFESAQALAEDLGRFLRGEVILARPISHTERVWKWCRREPRVAFLAAVVMVVVPLGFGGVVWQWQKAVFERNQAQEAQALIDIQRAENLFEAGDSALALARLGEVLRRNPNHHLAAQRVVAALHQLNYAIPLPSTNDFATPSLASKQSEGETQPQGRRLSPDGKMELVLGTNAAVIVDALTAKPVAPALQHEAPVSDMAFSPDGAWVATASYDNTVRLWETRSGQLAAPPLRHSDAVLKVWFADGGREVATVTSTGIPLYWALVLGQGSHTPLQCGSRVEFMEFDPSNQYLCVGHADHSCAVWDTTRSVQVTRLLAHTASVRTAGLSANAEYLATLAEDDSLRIWRTTSSEQVISPIFSTFQKPTKWRSAGTNLSVQIGGDRRQVHIRDVRKPGDQKVLSFMPVPIWDQKKGALPRYVRPVFQSVHLSPDESRVLGISEDGTYAFWSMPDCSFVGDSSSYSVGWQKVFGSLTCVDFSPDSKQVAIATDQGVTVLNALTGLKLRDPSPKPDPAGKYQVDLGFSRALTWGRGASFVNFCRGGRYLLTVSTIPEGSFTLWNVETRQSEGYAFQHGRIKFAGVSSDGSKFVTCSADRTTSIFDLNAAKPVHTPLALSNGVSRAWFSSDASCVITLTEDEDFQVWDCATGKAKTEPIRMAGRIASLTRATVNDRILKVSANSVQVWNSETGELLSAFMRHAGPVGFASFSPDSMRVVTCSADTTARLWDAESG